MTIRLRLAFWCAAIFSTLFMILAVFIYTVHARALYRDLDETLAVITSHYQGELDRQLATGAPLRGALLPALNIAGQQFVGAQLTIYDDAGNVILGTPVPGALPITSAGSSPPQIPAIYQTLHTPSGRVRINTLPVANGAMNVGYVQTSVSLAPLDRSIARFRLLLIAVAAGGLVAAIICSLATANRVLRPIAEVTETARAIALSRGFGRRLDPIGERDELGELVRTFNEMLDSLEEGHRAQRRFVDNAAHELRAPLTSLIGNLDLMERARDLPDVERGVILTDVRAEARRVGRMVNELLTLARADSGQRLARAPVELDRIVVDVVRQEQPLADGVELGIGAFAPVIVQGDVDLLRQLLLILVENALHYTPAGGKVRLALRATEGEVLLSIADTGIGIAPDDLPRIFDRFFRADPTRSRVAGGSGLGLAIAKWIAEAHEGRIDVESQPGQGSTFTVSLPVTGGGVDPEITSKPRRRRSPSVHNRRRLLRIPKK